MKLRKFAVATLLLAVAWVAFGSAAVNAAGAPKFDDGAALIRQSSSAATIVVGDRDTRVRSIGLPFTDGTLGFAIVLITIMGAGAAYMARAFSPRPQVRHASLQRGPPVISRRTP